MSDCVYTIQSLADRWQVHYTTVYRMIQSGKLKTFKIGDQVRITAKEVIRHWERDAVRHSGALHQGTHLRILSANAK